MSYDVWAEIDTGGIEPATVSESINMTSNVAGMWRLAMPETDGLAGMAGMLCADCVPVLRKGIADMEDNPAKYRLLTPANGWGSYEGALSFLRQVLTIAVSHPKASIGVCR